MDPNFSFKNDDDISDSKNLTQSQKAAVESDADVLVIEAGPGAGKTFVLIERINYLLNVKNVDPKSILVITFTEKAARELKRRLRKDKNIELHCIDQMHISTIHGFCNVILKDYFSSGVDIIDDEDNDRKTMFLKKHRKELGFVDYAYVPEDELKLVVNKFNEYSLYEVNPDELIEYVSNTYFKNKYAAMDERYKGYIDDLKAENGKDFQFPEEEVTNNRTYKKRWYANKFLAVAKGYKVYLEILNKNGKYDFNHLQIRARKYLEKNRDKIRFKNIFIDEFQDTDKIQLDIFNLLLEGSESFTVVGDPDQSIYSWRGANPEFFKEFGIKYERVLLEDNFRSPQNIVNFNEHYFRRYRGEEKVLNAFRKDERGYIYKLFNEDFGDEAVKIVNLIKSLKNKGKINQYSDIALLFRSTALKYTEPIIRQLENEKIKYTIKGTTDFKEQHEIIAFMYLLRYLADIEFDNEFNLDDFANPHANEEVFNFSKDTLKIFNNKSYENISFYNRDELAKFGLKDNDLDFFDKLNRLKRSIHKTPKTQENKENSFENGKMDLLSIYYNLFNITGYIEKKTNEDKEEHNELYNLAFLSTVIKNYMEIADRYDINGLVNYLYSYYDGYAKKTGENEKDKVQLMTVHKAKGLEFPIVFLCSIRDKGFPLDYFTKKEGYELPLNLKIPKEKHPKGVKNVNRELRKMQKELFEAEEKRIIYVGLTRARDVLVISGIRNKSGLSKEIRKMLEDRNVDEINPHVISEFREFESVVDEKELINLSFTGLMDYENCPHGYNLIHNYKFEKPQNVSMRIGSIVHSALEKIHETIKVEGDIEEVEVNRIIGEAENSNPDLIDNPSFKNALEKIREYIDDMKYEWVIKDAEFPFSIQKENYILTGQIDLIVNEDGEDADFISLIDFKTAKSDAILRNDDQNERQLHLYCLALRNNPIYEDYEIENLRIVPILDYDETTIEEEYYEVDEDIIDELNELLDKSSKNIEDKNFDKTNDKEKCHDCLLKEFCQVE